jgi:hypothetical protein
MIVREGFRKRLDFEDDFEVILKWLVKRKTAVRRLRSPKNFVLMWYISWPQKAKSRQTDDSLTLTVPKTILQNHQPLLPATAPPSVL